MLLALPDLPRWMFFIDSRASPQPYSNHFQNGLLEKLPR